MTRARDRLVVEWPLAAEEKENEPRLTASKIMTDECEFSVADERMSVGEVSFPISNHVCSPAIPSSFQNLNSRMGMETKKPRSLRYSIKKNQDVALVQVLGPSNATSTKRSVPTSLKTSVVAPGVLLNGGELLIATEKGTAIHEAFRILLQRPDLEHRVGPHCRLNESDAGALAAQANGLRVKLSSLGYEKLYVEQPLEITLEDGGVQTAIIDLLAEGENGYLIIDHKSGPVKDHSQRYASYWPQLAAYVDIVNSIGPKQVKSIGVFWTDTGELTFGNVDQFPNSDIL